MKRSTITRVVSIDALVLVLACAATIHQESFVGPYFGFKFTYPATNAIAVGLILLYLIVDILCSRFDPSRVKTVVASYWLKAAILGSVIGLLVIVPTLNAIWLRHLSHPWLWAHDTSINVEEATKFLLAGKDPYAQTYFNTPLARFGWQTGSQYGYGPNPALWLTDTFPGQELITVPFMLLSNMTLHWFDERFVYLAALAVTIFFLIKLAPSRPAALALVAGVCLNPLWVYEFVYGQNDILLLASVVTVIFAASKRAWRSTLVLLACSCALKQTSLILVPFLLYWMALQMGDTWRDRVSRLGLFLPWFAVPFILMVGPFALWNWTAFMDGNFGYVSGAVKHSYPIQGFNGWGMASFVLWGGLVSGPNAYFPFSLLELGAALPLLILALRRMKATTSITVVIGGFATVLLAVFYFSRFFHASYVAFTVDLFLIAALCHTSSNDEDDGHVSLDLIVVLLLVPPLLDLPSNRAYGITASIAMGLVLTYAVVDFVAPWRRSSSRWARILTSGARTALLATLVCVTVLTQATTFIAARLRWHSATYMHDTALQLHLSAASVLGHRNPYVDSFVHTPLWSSYVPAFANRRPIAANIPLFHNSHLPLDILASVPIMSWFRSHGLEFDQNYIYIGAFLICAALVTLIAKPGHQSLGLLAVILFSPLFAGGIILGQDDVLIVLCVVVAILFMQRGWLLLASLLIGTACALKVTAWPLAPLYCAYVISLSVRGVSIEPLWRRIVMATSHSIGRLWTILPPLIASILPFYLWNPARFVADTLQYPLGLIPNSLPLDQRWGDGYMGNSYFATLGYSQIAVSMGWARLNGSGFNGIWIGAIVGALLMIGLIVLIVRSPGIQLLLASYAILLFTVEYFSRFMVSSSIAYCLLVAPLAFYVQERRKT